MPLKDKRVVITRPAHQAESLKKRLEAAGAEVILFPLIEIIPPNDLDWTKEQLSHLQQYDLIVFISANAVKQAFNYIDLKELELVKVATTGKKTASILKEFGVHVDFYPKEIFNSEALLAMPDFKSFCEGKNIAIIRGEGGRDFLKEQLQITAETVNYINTYQRIYPQKSLDLLVQKNKNRKGDTILLTSGTSVENFFDLIKTSKELDWVNSLTLILGSPRMQKKIPESFQGKLAIAEDPSDETIYKELTQNYQ